MRRVLAFTGATLRQHARDLPTLAAAIGSPLLLTAFHRLLHGAEGFARWVPALVVFALLQLVFASALQVARERAQGTAQRLRMTRLTAAEFLVSLALAELAVSTVAVALTWGLAASFGFESFAGWSTIGVLCGLTGLAHAAMGLAVGAVSSSATRAFILASFMMFVLLLFSGLVFPMPTISWFQVDGQPWGPLDVLPTRHAMLSLSRVLNGESLSDVLENVIALAVLSAVWCLLGVGAFHRWVWRRSSVDGVP